MGPEIAFRARFDGYLQWVCPHCQSLNAGNRQKIDFRRPQARCQACNRRFPFGFHFGSPKNGLPITSLTYIDAPTQYLTHVVGPHPGGVGHFGRALGTLWWVCGCRKLKKSSLSLDSSTISCPDCRMCYNLGVIFYKSVKGRAKPMPTPLDWVLPVWDLHV